MKHLDSRHVYRLTDAEKNNLANALDAIVYDPHGSTRYITSIRAAMYSTLPYRIIEVLSEQKASLNPHPYLIIENTPCDEQIFKVPDPRVYSPSSKSGSRSENLSIGISSLLGEPYSIVFEGSDIVNNLIPIKEAKDHYTGLGSEVELDFHIENAALKFMGDYNLSPQGLILTGVNHDPNGPLTRISDARNAVNTLTDSDINYLRSPLYKIKLPYRWRDAINRAPRTTTAFQ